MSEYSEQVSATHEDSTMCLECGITTPKLECWYWGDAGKESDEGVDERVRDRVENKDKSSLQGSVQRITQDH